jgi:hypothetical protein
MGTVPGTEQLFYLLLVILISDNLIRPHILPNRLNDKEYLRFLGDTLPNLLDVIMQGMWYLYDGAPPHYARQVMQWMNQNYSERWIERKGPTPRFSDLNKYDTDKFVRRTNWTSRGSWCPNSGRL